MPIFATLVAACINGLISFYSYVLAYQQAIAMLLAGTAKVGAFHTQIFPLAKAEEAIHRLAGWDGKPPAIHVMVDPWSRA